MNTGGGGLKGPEKPHPLPLKSSKSQAPLGLLSSFTYDQNVALANLWSKKPVVIFFICRQARSSPRRRPLHRAGRLHGPDHPGDRSEWGRRCWAGQGGVCRMVVRQTLHLPLPRGMGALNLSGETTRQNLVKSYYPFKRKSKQKWRVFRRKSFKTGR